MVRQELLPQNFTYFSDFLNTLYFFENFIQILLDFLLCLRYNSICSQEWWNRQTRRLQVPVVAIPCGFKSHLLHRRNTISDFAYRIFLYLKRCGRYAKLRGGCADPGKWGLCGMKTRSRSVSLAAVLSFQPRSGSYRLAAASPAQLKAKDRRLPKVFIPHSPHFPGSSLRF